MDFKKFLIEAAGQAFWQQQRTLCFVGGEYPAAFFVALFDLLRKNNKLLAPFQRVDIVGREKRELYGLFGQCMLGSQSFFWLGTISDERESKAAAAFKQYICGYDGPHSMAFFVEATDLPPSPSATIVQLPVGLDMQDFIFLGQWLGFRDIEKKTALFEGIFSSRKQPLQECILLYDYIALGSMKQGQAFYAYLQELYAPDISLQQLAEYFFAKRDSEFFAAWDKLQGQYPPIFWVMFWTEQVWRALHVAKFMQQKQFVNAKKMSFRLPYSFINKGWQQVDLSELVECYEFLYQIDYAIKTGSTFCSQELFFVHYFTGIFVKKGDV